MRPTSPVSGVKVKGNHLIFTLTHAAPDFLARTAMPFFCAVPTNLTHDPNGVLAPASAGPYYISDRVPNKSITIKKNPYYKGKRPHNVSEINYVIGNSLDATYLRVQQGATDYAAGGIPPRVVCRGRSEVWRQQGPVLGQAATRRARTWPSTMTGRCSRVLPAPIWRRRSTTRSTGRRLLAQGGYLAGKRTDQILPPGIAGFRDANLYPLKGPDLTTAKKWTRRPASSSGTNVELLHVEPWRCAAAGADLPVQPEADRPEREHAPVRACRSDQQGRHPW